MQTVLMEQEMVLIATKSENKPYYTFYDGCFKDIKILFTANYDFL